VAGEVAFSELGEDTERGRAFSERLFGWQFEPGPSGSGFTIASPSIPGGMHGSDAGAAPYLVCKVDDIEAALRRVRELGGSVEEMEVEGDAESTAQHGRFKLCRDDQGSQFGLHQPPSRS